MDWQANAALWLLNAAGALARAGHHGQVDKAGQDYFAAHLADVQRRVAAAGGTPAQQAGALLHDLLEDTSMTVHDMTGSGVWPSVVEVVQLLTKRKGEPNEVYYARIVGNADALVVKLADVGSNTDPVRLQVLDEQTRQRLTVKYRKALFALAGREVYVEGQALRLRPGLSLPARTLALRLAAQLGVPVEPVCVMCHADAGEQWAPFCGEGCFDAHDEEFARDVTSGRFDRIIEP